MNIQTNKDKGRAGLSLAISYFSLNWYTVSLPLNDTQWYDLIIEKDGIFQTVQCKFTATKDNAIILKSNGGTKGQTYDSVLNHQLDYLFCANENLDMWLIPLTDLKQSGNTKAIKLRKEYASKAHPKFDTTKYIIHF